MSLPDSLVRVKRAARTKRRSEEEYRAALVAAQEDNQDMAAIGKAAGITRQGVRDLLLRERANEQQAERSAAPE